MQRAIVRTGWFLMAPRLLMGGGGSKDTWAGALGYELVWRCVRGDGKRVEARQHSRRPNRARRRPAVQLDPCGQMPTVWPGDQRRKPEAMCASTFCRSGDSTTATANLQIDALIQQQLGLYVKSITPAYPDRPTGLPRNFYTMEDPDIRGRRRRTQTDATLRAVVTFYT